MTEQQDRALLNSRSYSTRGKPGREINSLGYLKVGNLDATQYITVINQKKKKIRSPTSLPICFPKGAGSHFMEQQAGNVPLPDRHHSN